MDCKKLIILLNLVNLSFGSRSYCSLPYCGDKNILCNNTGNYGENCVPNARSLPMARYRSSLLNIFNDFRNKVAGGEFKRFVLAARMAKMSWSNELENMAHLSAITCTSDKYCMSSDNFYYIGTIMDSFYYEGTDNLYDNYQIMSRLIEAWLHEVASFNIGMTVSLPNKLERRDMDKAALLMMDRNTHVGCASLRSTYNKVQQFVFICAFSTDLLIDLPIYKLSRRAGSSCRRLDKAFPKLCAQGEKYGNEKEIIGARVFSSPSNNPKLLNQYQFNEMYV